MIGKSYKAPTQYLKNKRFQKYDFKNLEKKSLKPLNRVD